MDTNTLYAVAYFAGAGLGLAMMTGALFESRRQQERRRREIAQAQAVLDTALALRRDYWRDMVRQIAAVDDINQTEQKED